MGIPTLAAPASAVRAAVASGEGSKEEIALGSSWNTSAYRSAVIVMAAEVPCAMTTTGTGLLAEGR